MSALVFIDNVVVTRIIILIQLTFLFSKMKFIKRKSRSNLTDENRQRQLRRTNIHADIDLQESNERIKKQIYRLLNQLVNNFIVTNIILCIVYIYIISTNYG